MDFLIPVLRADQMRLCDAATIASEPISSLELMERASRAMYNLLKKQLSHGNKIAVFCGPGNNGGDGLCIARMLLSDGLDVQTYHCVFDKKISADNAWNHKLLHNYRPHQLHTVKEISKIDCHQYDVIIDALFGTGLSKALEGDFTLLVEKINASGKKIIALDTPSGLLDNQPQLTAAMVHADITITIESPKFSFFYPENKIAFEIARAQINLEQAETNCYYLSPEVPWKQHILQALPSKPTFGHKGNSGHVLLVGGNNGMHGAIELSATGCISHGAGLTTVLAPPGARLYLGNLPKAMHIPRKIHRETIPMLELEKYSVLCIGPGLGTGPDSLEFLRELLKKWDRPVILDADALNILAAHKTLWKLVKAGSIITPHPGEFQRLFGAVTHSSERWEMARKIAEEKNIYILAKDKYSALICPDGRMIFNGSGGPELAQGGSGDTLSGALAAWFARTGNPEISAMAAMYLCGLGAQVN